MPPALLFSIIIPTLNEEKCLPKLLSDIRKQSFTNYEVIIADGGSRDKTVSVAKKFHRDMGLKFINSNKPNVSAQRNRAALDAGGRWLIFMDADVRLGADFLEKAARVLISDNLDCAAVNYSVDTKSAAHNLLQKWLYWYMLLTSAIGYPRVVETLFICSRGSFKKVGGFDENVKVNEGSEFVHRARQQGIKFAVLQQISYKLSPRRLEKQGAVRWLANQVLIELCHLGKVENSSSLFSKLYPMDDRYR